MAAGASSGKAGQQCPCWIAGGGVPQARTIVVSGSTTARKEVSEGLKVRCSYVVLLEYYCAFTVVIYQVPGNKLTSVCRSGVLMDWGGGGSNGACGARVWVGVYGQSHRSQQQCEKLRPQHAPCYDMKRRYCCNSYWDE